jgi:ketosteroid isomerase-like protein
MPRTDSPQSHDATPHRRAADLAHDVQAFLDRFARALTGGDVHAIAALWETPAFVLGDDDVHDVRAIDEVEQFFGGARQQYRAQGIVDTRAEILHIEALTPRVCSVRVRWPYLDERGRELGAETSSYLLRRDAGGRWRLRVAVLQGVEENPAARH